MAAELSVLTRKLRRGGIARSPLADTELIWDSLERGLEDRLRPLLKTLISASVGSIRVSKLADATAPISTPALLGLVEVEDADTPALIAAHCHLAYHLIDLSLGGDPGAAPEPDTRAFTAIDMALLRLYLDAILGAFGHAIGNGLGRPLTKTMRIRDERQSLKQFRLAPDYIDVLVFEAELSLGEGGRRGGFSIILPLSTMDVIRASVQQQNQAAERERPNDLWKALMRRAAAAAPVPVDAVLHRQTLSISALRALSVGQVLEIPGQSVDEIRLTIPQPGNRSAVLALGKLGAYQDHKVVKLSSDPDARVLSHIDRALRSGRAAAPAAATPDPQARPVRKPVRPAAAEPEGATDIGTAGQPAS
jgi:flagellar motor switch protein FliM